MTTPTETKTQLRARLRRRRRALTPQQQGTASRATLNYLEQLPDWPSRRHIGLYLSADGELSPHDIATHCRSLGRQLYLPRITGHGQMAFVHWAAHSTLTPNRFGIAEPPAQAAKRNCSDLDLVFLPVVGWDRAGHRLGMGGGYYDRLLATGTGALRVGLAHSVQEVPQVPTEEWDISLDFVLTEEGLHRCCGAS